MGEELFDLGRIIGSARVADELGEEASIDLLGRHARGDFGDIPQEDTEANLAQIERAQRGEIEVASVYSAYREGFEEPVGITTYYRPTSPDEKLLQGPSLQGFKTASETYVYFASDR